MSTQAFRRLVNEGLFQRLCPPVLQDAAIVHGKRLRGTKFILIACFPKSGSSFLAAALGHLPGFTKMSAVPSYGRREQELEVSRLHDLRMIPRNTVFAHHVRCSAHTKHVLDRYPFHLVVLTRNLSDVIRSLEDHMGNESTAWPMAFMDATGLDLVDQANQRLDFITDLFVPWYLNFYVSWKRYEQAGGSVQWLRFEDMIRNENETVAGVLSTAGLHATPKDVADAVQTAKGVRLNVGVSGRGDSILRDNPHVAATLKRYLTYYPDVDFSPIA